MQVDLEAAVDKALTKTGPVAPAKAPSDLRAPVKETATAPAAAAAKEPEKKSTVAATVLRYAALTVSYRYL